MPLTRLHVDARLGPGVELTLGKDPAKYLGRVLRLKKGDAVHVFNGRDGEWLSSITSFGKERVSLKVEKAVTTSSESALGLHLVQGISRGDRMDFVVQKATELGVARITPVLSAHSVVKLDGGRADRRREHWQKIAESACEQSGRTRPPVVDAPVGLNDWFGSGSAAGDTLLIFRPDAAAAMATISRPAGGLTLLIGPEGGFSEREYVDAELAGFRAVSFGPRILRTETAAVAALAVAQALWGDLA